MDRLPLLVIRLTQVLQQPQARTMPHVILNRYLAQLVIRLMQVLQRPLMDLLLRPLMDLPQRPLMDLLLRRRPLILLAVTPHLNININKLVSTALL